MSPYEGIPYNLYLDTSVGRCSIDSLRIKFTYKYTVYSWEKHCVAPSIDRISYLLDFLGFESFLHVDVSWTYKDFFKIGAYARICCISGDDWSCAVLIGRYCYDSSCKLVSPEAVFDYNPNKVPADVAARIIGLLRSEASSVSVTRFDVAFDLPIARADLVLVRDAKRSYKLFDDAGAVTEYQGARGSHGALKVYDKSAESGLDVPVSRVELTVEKASFQSMSQIFPKLYSFNGYQLDMAFSTLPFQVQACVLHSDLIPVLKSSVSRDTYRKYVTLMDSLSGCNIVPDDFRSIDSFVLSSLRYYLGVMC